MRKLVMLLLAPLVLFGVSGKRASLVKTQVVQKAEVKSLQTFVGTVIYAKSSKVASQRSGAVVFVGFKEGDNVKKGKVLNRLDNLIIKAQISSLKATLNEVLVGFKKAKKDLARYDVLIKKDAVSQSVYDDNSFSVESLENKIGSLKANIKAKEIEMSKMVTLAPFDGVIVSKKIEVGDWVGQGGVVAELINLKSAQVVANIPQGVALDLKPKMPVNVVIDGKNYDAYISAIIPKGDISTRTFPVKISFKKNISHLFEGMSVAISIQSGIKIKSLVVPRDAVLKRFGQDVVFVDVKGSAVMIPVTIIGYVNGKVAVSAKGLSVGMKVVTKGNERIFPKSPLKEI